MLQGCEGREKLMKDGPYLGITTRWEKIIGRDVWRRKNLAEEKIFFVKTLINTCILVVFFIDMSKQGCF